MIQINLQLRFELLVLVIGIQKPFHRKYYKF